MQLAQPRNSLILASLSVSGAGKDEIVRYDAVPAAQAYLGCGCHPDVVERVWDEIGSALPTECRHLLYGIPALIHPTGLILAIGMGTQYGIRILPSASKAAEEAGTKTVTFWSGGGGMDIRETYGSDWIFGSWLVQELTWCQAVYAACESREDLLAEPPLVTEPAAGARPKQRDFAALEAEERRAHQAKLEQLAAAGDLEATFKLSEVLMNAAFKQRSWAFLERAEQLLSAAAAGGYPQALAMLAAWPHLLAQAEQQFPKRVAPGA